jgi:hypothetical protein
MSVTGFWFDQTEGQGVEDLINTRQALVNGVTYSEGDVLQVATTGANTGLAIQIPAQTSPGQFVFMTMKSAPQYLRPAIFNDPVYNEAPLLYDVDKTSFVFRNQIAAATYDGTAANANTANNTVIWTGTGTTAATDFLGGTIYVNELGEQGIITALSVSGGSGGTYTATVQGVIYTTGGKNRSPVTPPAGGTPGGFSQAVTTGNTIRVVPWGPGYRGGVQFQATNPQQGVSVAIAGKTGGCLYIYDVELAGRNIYVRFDSSLI